MNKKQRQLDAATRIANRHPDLHPWMVAVTACNWDKKADYKAFLCGMLHDSIEDDYSSFGELRAEGIPETVVVAVGILTRDDGEPYWDYIERIKIRTFDDAGRLAKKVKLADATVNLARCMESEEKTGRASSLKERYRRVIEELS